MATLLNSGLKRRAAQALGLTVAVFAACVATVVPAAAQLGPSDLQTELDAARQHWAETEPVIYEVREQVTCYSNCFYVGDSWTRVVNGVTEFVIDEATGGPAKGYRIDEIFDLIQTAIDNDWDVVSVVGFDAITGVPGPVRLDPDSTFSDEPGEGTIRVVDIIDRTQPKPGAMSPAKVATAASCLAGRGRVDVNIVNNSDSTARFRIEFEGLTAREYDVAPRGIWRMPFTGRPNGTYAISILRDGQPYRSETLPVYCGDNPQTFASSEVQVINGCGTAAANRGEVRFQFVNPTAVAKPYVIKFSGRPGRSTTAAPGGQAIRAVTGLADGQYVAQIYSGLTVVDQFMVNVDC